MKNLFITLLLCILSQYFSAQRIEKVRFEQDGKVINIYYDLIATNPSDKFEIKAYYSTDGGTTWGSPLSKVTGNVRENQVAGNNKKITWDVLAEREKLQGNVMFEIRAILQGSGTFTDNRDGNTYRYVKIGGQVWMAQNLNYNPRKDSWCYKDILSNCTIYGRLYTWDAAMNGSGSSNRNPSGVQGVCPAGWHLPSDDEWKQLEMHLGISQAEAYITFWRGTDWRGTDWRGTDEGGKLKETGTKQWNGPNIGGTNSSGFSALPGGSRSYDGNFDNIGSYASYWSSTESNSYRAWRRTLGSETSAVGRSYHGKGLGFSVRCLRDD